MSTESAAPKVSICVPVFNTERFLPRCLDSLLTQTLREIEIVIVNDGSSDGSQEIIDAYAARDARVVHVMQTNAGLGATRNAGIRLATGEFVAFVDSDDWVEPDHCEALYEAAAASGADLVVCDYWVHYPERSLRPPLKVTHRAEVLDREAYLRAILERTVAGFSWNKLYRRARLVEQGLAFPTREELENVEDQFYSLRAVHAARDVAFLSRPLVHYQIHSESIVQRYQPTLFRDQAVLYGRNTALLCGRDARPWVRRAIDAAFLEGVFRCALNECKDTNPAGVRARVAALARVGRDPLFRRVYSEAAKQGRLGWKMRGVLAPLRFGAAWLAYALAAGYHASIRRKVL